MTTNKKPKIAVIGLKGLPAFGGAATVGENIIEQLKGDYEFTVYSVSSHTNNKTGLYKEICYQKVLKSFPFKKINSLLYYLRSAFHALFNNYDLIHLHHRDAAFIIPLLKIRHKVILTTHGVQLKEISKWANYNWFFNSQLKYFTKYSDYITSVSQSDKRILKINYNLTSHYIPNGISFYDSIKKLNRNGYIFFSAGRIISSKGCHILLEALISMDYKGKVIISGSLDHELDYKNYIINLSKKINVEFTGLIRSKEQLMDYLKNALFFVFPSFNESMSMMLLEAVSMKTPVIASDIKANTDIFNNDEILFFRNKSIEDLKAKLEWASRNIDEMNNKALNAYDRAFKEYDWEKIALQYKLIYKNLID